MSSTQLAQVIVDEEIDDVFGDHCWHYRYNRRLSCFQNCVTSLCFSQDGHYLVSGTGSGDVKVWDTGVWAEAARLKGCSKEEPRALAISPSQRWLVCAHASVMNIYMCHAPWRLEHAMPPPMDMVTKEASEWCCIAFSPMSEVDHPGGHTGQDNHLAAFAKNVLCVLDYSGGWSAETPKRTRSVFNSSRPTSIAYTACGFWIVCGYECGQLQIWNHFSLTLEKTLSAHTGIINGITASPRCAPYDARFVSCSVDRSLRVWHSAGWCLEQIAPDTRADRNGIRCCSFSSTGNWLVSVAAELCVWSVCVSSKHILELRLHQRMEAVCGAEGLCVAAFCSQQDALAVGSRDGVLGLWTQVPGMPSGSVKQVAASTVRRTGVVQKGVATWILDRPLAKEMMKVSPDGANRGEADETRKSLQNSEWFVRTDLRSLNRTTSMFAHSMKAMNAKGERTNKPSPVTPDIRAKLLAGRDRARKTAVHDGDCSPETGGDSPNSTALEKCSSLPELKRWKPTGHTALFEDVLSAYCNATGKTSVGLNGNMSKTLPPDFFGHAGKQRNSTCWGIDGDRSTSAPNTPALGNDLPSMRKSVMQHAAQGVVRRVTLDPQSIC